MATAGMMRAFARRRVDGYPWLSSGTFWFTEAGRPGLKQPETLECPRQAPGDVTRLPTLEKLGNNQVPGQSPAVKAGNPAVDLR